MSYTRKDFDTKSQLKAAIARLNSSTWAAEATPAEVAQLKRDLTIRPTAIVGGDPTNGTAFLEGPQYPRAHRWYAQVEITDSVVTKLIS